MLLQRDLKPQNLLLSTSKSGALLKIADFGFARNLQPQGLAETLCGSPLYMAPEILQFQKYDAKADLWSVGTILFELVVGEFVKERTAFPFPITYSAVHHCSSFSRLHGSSSWAPRADCFCVSCSQWFLLITGKPPFNGANHVALLRNIERQEAAVPAALAKTLSASCVALLHGLLKRNPVERMSFEEFFMHPFLRSGSRASSACDSSSSSQSSSLLSSAEPSPVKGPSG
jgi:serine/threonine-protein kinase ULK/ATG1